MGQQENNAEKNPRRAGQKLRNDEAERLAQHIADVTSVPLPLAAGLRAVADEESNRRLAKLLCHIAAQLEAGRALDDILNDAAGRLPRHYRGLLEAAVGSGRLGEVLAECTEHRRRSRELWRTVAASLAYPSLIVALTLALLVFFFVVIVPPFIEIYSDFGLTLPARVIMLFWWSETGIWWLLWALAGGPTFALLTRLSVGAARWQRIVSTVPLLGAMGHWTAVAEMTRLLGLMVQQQMPLPAALICTADGISSANLRQVCSQLAAKVEQGESLSQAVARTDRLPGSLVPLLEWGERSAALGEALRTVGELFEGRVRQRAAILKSIGPPAVFVIVAIVTVTMISGLFAPLVGMISGLSY